MFFSELIIGTTASGKSAYAVEEARKVNGVVLSIDALSVYSQLNIGTAKPKADILNEIPHFCINIADIDKPFTVVDFKKEALRVIDSVIEMDRPLFVTVGSFFYLKALLTETSLIPPTDREIEKILKSRIEKNGLESLYEELKTVDPKTAIKVHPHDRYRISRALAVYLQTGVPLSSFINENNLKLTRPKWLGKVTTLNLDNSTLEEKIKIRTADMLKNGLIEEVETILKSGYQETLRPLLSVGYKEVIGHIQGKISGKELPDLISRSTIKLAKRQRTWIRNGFKSLLS